MKNFQVGVNWNDGGYINIKAESEEEAEEMVLEGLKNGTIPYPDGVGPCNPVVDDIEESEEGE